jgi:putative transposase
MIQDRHGFSERRACKLVGQPRSTQRRPAPVVADEEEHIRARLRDLARQRPRYGYRRMTALLREEGFCVNHKRIQRLCRDEGLRVLRAPKKRYRVGVSTVPATRLRATHPDNVWAIDFVFDQTSDLKTLKILAVTDEFTKEALAIEVARSIDADHTVRVLDRIVARTGRRPELLRMDNGPELLDGEIFETLLEAQVLAEDFRIDYNTYRPHSSLEYLAPATFAEQWRVNEAGLPEVVDS